MKRLLFTLVSSGVISAASYGQSIDDIKNLVMLSQYKAAKEKLDPAMAKPKFIAKPEAFILKATVYAGLLNDSAMAGQSDQLRTEAMTAYKKYLELDAKKELINVPPYNNPPLSFYSSYFNQGIKDYNKKEWASASENFKNTVYWSDYIIDNKLAAMTFDTTANLLAGAAYQNNKNEEEAVKYFSRLTDKKIGGEDNEFMYQFLVGYYFRKYDIANFEKLKATGAELYPKSEYFGYSEEDFIMSLEDEVDKQKRIEAKLAADPSNAALTETYGLMLFDQLNGEEGKPKPANYEELEQKMVTFLSKSGDLNPQSGKAYYYLGNHYVNKGVKINEDIRAVTDEIRKFNASAKPNAKTGKLPPPPAELTEKRTALQKSYDGEIDKALPFLLKSAEAYGKATGLKGVELQNYKRLADQLILIYGDKKAISKVPADKAKFEAEEKKWSDIYNKISH